MPAEVVRQHVQSRAYKSSRAAFSGIVKQRGPLGLYSGYGAALARDLPFDTLQVSVNHPANVLVHVERSPCARMLE